MSSDLALLSREHPVLLDAAADVLADLRYFQGQLQRGRVAHYQHDVFAERALSLELYLSSALRLCHEEQYLPAYAILRAALEHHLIDRLLFVGRRYKRVYTEVKKSDYEKFRSDWRSGQPGTEDIVRIEWKDGTVVVVRTGLHPAGGTRGTRGRTLSIYYFLLHEFDPFIGPPHEQVHLARGFAPIKQHIEPAKQQQGLYRPLRWNEIKSNLAENRLCGGETLRRFEVHYRFLSAFVHPVPAGYDLVYGRNRPTGAPRYDHYASELVLLYINKLAAGELRFLKRMASRPPSVRLRDWPIVEAHIRASDAAAAHLWFPGEQPHNYDYIEEANSRGVRRGQLVRRDRRPTPSQLRPAQVRYYRNPLRRLIRMHQSFHELTGFAYISPWPREDAAFK
jgi:hypothetical protein